MKILFLGDSITDAGRDRSDDASLGNGYVSLLAEKLRPLYEDTQFTILNRGVSGDRVFDIAARLEKDCLSEKADAVILFVGVNDVWHKYTEGTQFDGQMFQHHLACISFLIKTKIADVPQLFENNKTAVHWAKKLKKTEGYKNNKEAQKFAGKLLETLRRMKAILKNL